MLRTRFQQARRRGATMTLFAILLPVLVLLSAMAVNIAYMQLTATELKVAVDASAKAGGRALSIHQNTDSAWDYAQSTAALNSVSGTPLAIEQDETDIQFGISQRLNNGYGRFAFTQVPKANVDSGVATATSVKVTGDSVVPLLFRGFASFADFSPATYSVATQVDRDIALVLDRSGSMAYNENEEEYLDELLRLRNNGTISSSEYNDASDSLYDRYANSDVRNALPQTMSEYATDLNTYNNSNGNAPRHSRWSWVEAGVDAFLQVLENTDQEEQVSLATFCKLGATRPLSRIQLLECSQYRREHASIQRDGHRTGHGGGTHDPVGHAGSPFRLEDDRGSHRWCQQRQSNAGNRRAGHH